MLQNLPSKPRGRRKYAAVMCPVCRLCDTHKKGPRWRCNECRITFVVNADGTTTHNKALGDVMREVRQGSEAGNLENARRVLSDIIAIGVIPVSAYAKRPHCFKCQKPVTGRGFHHRSRGGIDDVICDMCVRGTVTRKLFQ